MNISGYLFPPDSVPSYGVSESELVKASKASKPNCSIPNLIKRYGGEICHLFCLPRHINLSVREVLRTCLAPDCSDDVVDSALYVVFRVYEKSRQILGLPENGLVFAMHPEPLAYLMGLKKEVVLGIAEAGGENATLLAYADGARRVYVNDITPQEIEQFENLKCGLPPVIREKLESIQGDCFRLLTMKPELAGNVDLILCRNLIHFFNDQQLLNFFQLVKSCLKSNGVALITAQSCYAFRVPSEFEKDIDDNTQATCFEVTRCDIYMGGRFVKPVFNSMVPSDEHLISKSTNQEYQPCQFRNGEWKINHNTLKKLHPTTKTKLMAKLVGEPADLTSFEGATTVVTVSHQRLYTLLSLSRTLTKRGFVVESTYVTGQSGHLLNLQDRFTQGGIIGAIIRWPGAPARDGVQEGKV